MSENDGAGRLDEPILGNRGRRYAKEKPLSGEFSPNRKSTRGRLLRPTPSESGEGRFSTHAHDGANLQKALWQSFLDDSEPRGAYLSSRYAEI